MSAQSFQTVHQPALHFGLFFAFTIILLLSFMLSFPMSANVCQYRQYLGALAIEAVISGHTGRQHGTSSSFAVVSANLSLALVIHYFKQI